jgi:hypothetical protein
VVLPCISEGHPPPEYRYYAHLISYPIQTLPFFSVQ